MLFIYSSYIYIIVLWNLCTVFCFVTTVKERYVWGRCDFRWVLNALLSCILFVCLVIVSEAINMLCLSPLRKNALVTCRLLPETVDVCRLAKLGTIAFARYVEKICPYCLAKHQSHFIFALCTMADRKGMPSKLTLNSYWMNSNFLKMLLASVSHSIVMYEIKWSTSYKRHKSYLIIYIIYL